MSEIKVLFAGNEVTIDDEGRTHVKTGDEAAGIEKDETAEPGSFKNMLPWDADSKVFVAPKSVIGPPGWQNRNQSPFGDGAWVIPANSKIEKTLGTDILYVWGYKDGTESGGRIYMKMPQKGRSVDGSRVERLKSTGV